MKARLACILVPWVAVVVMCLGFGSARSANIYDLSGDYSLGANPNGAWSYGLEHNLGGAFTLLGFAGPAPGANDEHWSKDSSSLPGVYRNGSAQTLITEGGQGTFPPGTIWFVPGAEGSGDDFCVIRWTVPLGQAGSYRLETAVRRYLDGPLQGDTDFHVLLNGVELFGRFLAPPESTGYTNILSLSDGETIDFAIGRGQDNTLFGSGLKIQSTLTLLSSNPVPPLILAQPTSQTVTVGGTASFSVVAGGMRPLSYQWSFNGSAVPNATNVALMLSGVQFSDAGRYAVAVSNALGSAMSAEAELTVAAVPPAVLLRGPYLQAATPSNLVVRWRTDVPTDSQVHFGTAVTNLVWDVVEPTLTTEHSVTLTNLAPDMVYFYAIASSSQTFAIGNDYAFTTPSVGAKPTRIWAIGDAGTASFGSTAPLAVRDAYLAFTGARPTDVWLMLGDNAYLSGTDAEYQAAVFDVFGELLRSTPLWPTIGNHETYAATPDGHIPYYDIFSLPQQGGAGGVPSGTERYYSFDHANIHFVCLDSEISDNSPGSAMLTWLEQDLAANTKDWLIAYWHSPPYSKGSHNSDFEANLVEMRERVVPVLESHGVDLVLCGHSHSYERSYLLDGHYGPSSSLTPSMIRDSGSGRPELTGAYFKPSGGPSAHQGAVYVVAGSAGQTSGGFLNHPAMHISLNRLGSMVIDIDGDRLDARFLRENGTVDDQFTILKGSQAPVIISGPASQTVFPGSRVEFTVTAGGSPPLSYQWLFNGTPLPQANSATLVLTNVQEAQAGNYSVVVSNAVGAVESDEAVLMVDGATLLVVYDLSRDFSTASNPNGVWSYGWISTIGGPFTTLQFTQTVVVNGGIPIESRQLDPNLSPAVYHNGGTSTWHTAGGEGSFPPGTVWFHGGSNGRPENFGVIRFKVPAGGGGSHRIEAAVQPHFIPAFAGDTDFHVLRNGTELFGEFLPVNRGTGYTNTLLLSEGDTIDFVIGRGADGNEHASGLKIQATITAVSPPVATNCPAGLVGWWPLNGSGSNMVAGGSPAVPSGGATFVEGRVQQGLALDGVASFARVSTYPALNVGAGLGVTLEMWIKPDQVDQQNALLEWSDLGPQVGLHFWHSVSSPFSGGGPGSLFANLTDVNSVTHHVSSPPGLLRAAVFQHVALTYDRASGLARLFLDGSQVAQTNVGSLTLETRPDLYLGTRSLGDSPDRFRGVLDEIGIYDRALSPIQIAAIHAAGSQGKCAPPSLAMVHSLSQDFSLAANPNGVWSYGFERVLGGTFTLLPFAGPAPGAADEHWSRSGQSLPGVYRNGSTQTLITEGGQGNFPPGTMWFVPGPEGSGDDFCVIRWTVPAGQAGAYQLATAVRPYLDGSLQGDTDFHVLHNGVELFGQFLSPTMGTGYTNTLSLVDGETIDFAIGRGQDNHLFGSGLKIQATLTLLSSNAVAPVILVQPASQTVTVGGAVTLSVVAGGTAPLSYQWLFNGTPVPDGTNAMLRLNNVQSTQAGPYSVVVTNALGSGTSSEAVVSVQPRPTHDLSRDFSIAANSNGAWSYGWEPNLGEGFTLLTVAALAGSGSEHWAKSSGNPLAVYHNATESTLITHGGLGVFPPGTVWFLAGFEGSGDDFCVIRWTVPAGQGGAYRLETAVRPYLDGPPQGDTDFHVLHNGVELFGQFLSPTMGAGYTNTLSLGDGETIDFAVGRGQDDRLFGSALKIQATLTLLSSNAVAPVILVQPASQTVTVGEAVTLSAVAGGTPPLSYQWLFNGAPVSDATNAMLTLSNVQLSDAGRYSLAVSNAIGSATSAEAVVTVNFPPAVLGVVSVQAVAGLPVVLPVDLHANGNENALGFSLNFDPTLLSFDSVELGDDTPATAILVTNPNAAGDGRIGVAIALAANATFPAGTQQVARVNFTMAPVLNPVTTPVTFGDIPTARQISDAQAQAQPSAFVDGTVAVSSVFFEADVAPRPGGDRRLTVTDWVQLGRFVAGLDTVGSPSEFQRADCAPQAQRGNGILSVTDWVQGGRYAAGLDPLTTAGGPTSESGGAGLAAKGTPLSLAAGGLRAVRLMDANLIAGTITNVPVKLEAQGDENALAFSVSFDPAKLRFVAGAAGGEAAAALLNINTNDVVAGRIGVALALPAGATFTAGARELVLLQFSAPEATAGSTALAFGDSPVRREVSDKAAMSLAASYTGAQVMIRQPGPVLGYRVTGRTLVLFWPVANSDGFELESAPVVTGGQWAKVDVSPIAIGDYKLVTLQMTAAEAYFRLRK